MPRCRRALCLRCQCRSIGISRPDGERADGEPQQSHAHDHRPDGDEAGPEAREALRVFESYRPYNFQQSGNEQSDPCHLAYGCKRWGAAC